MLQRRVVIILPHPDGRGKPDGAGDHDDGEDKRDDDVGSGLAKHAGGHADDVPRRPVERQADDETLATALARPRQRGPGPDRPDEGELRRERGHGHGRDRDRRPRGRVREQRAAREEAGEGGEREHHSLVAGCGEALLEVYTGTGSWWMLWFG